MKKMHWALLLVIVMLVGTYAAAQETPKPVIAVSAAGKVKAKPDLAIVFMSVRSSAPLAADALDQNTKKVQTVQERLTALGYKGDMVKFTGNRFAPAGGAGMYYGPGGQRPTGFDVYNNLYITIGGADLADVAQFQRKLSTLLDELSKLGVSPAEAAISRVSMGGSSLVAFTVKDPAASIRDASAQAMTKARAAADEIARQMKVQITGVESVMTQQVAGGGMGVVVGPYASPVDELPYEYFSSSFDEVPIRVNLMVRYSFK